MPISRRSFALSSLLLFPAVLPAADVTPDSILDKYVETTGGRAAYEKVKNEVDTGTMEISAMSMKGTLTTYKSAGKSYTIIDLTGFGKAEEGTNGEVAWSINGMEGARVKQGDERAAALREAALALETHWHDFYKKAEVAGTEDVGGKPCYKLVLTPNEGAAETRYYDKSSNLLVKMLVPVTPPSGAITLELGLADYRDEGGILRPHTITEKLPSTDIVVKIESVKYNQEIAADRFDLPADIKAAMSEKK
jgi:hypothetical protein